MGDLSYQWKMFDNQDLNIGKEFIDRLRDSGFKEITEKHFPEDFRKLQLEAYHPLIHRRAFSKNNRCLLILEKGELVFHDEWTSVTGIRKSFLTEEEMKSLLIYSWLNNRMRSKYRKTFTPFNIRPLLKETVHYESLV